MTQPQLPYDILYRLFADIADTTLNNQKNQENRRFMYPFDHPALLSGPIYNDKPQVIRSCALVCRDWSLPASTVNVRCLSVRSVPSRALSAALSGPGRALLVQDLRIGRGFCRSCLDREAECPNGADMEALLLLLSRCPGLQHLALYEFISPTTSIDTIISTPPFTSIVSLVLGQFYRAMEERQLPIRTFCYFIRLFPCLTHLVISGIMDRSPVSPEDLEDIRDIPSPIFRLRTLAIKDEFRVSNAPWLLRNSTESLTTLWVHWFSAEDVYLFSEVLRLVQSSLEHLHIWTHMHPHEDISRIGSALHQCKHLKHIAAENMHSSKRFIGFLGGGNPTLQRLTLVSTVPLVREINGEEHVSLPLFHPRDVRELVEMLRSGTSLPNLRSIAIETRDGFKIQSSTLEDLQELQSTCAARNVVFRFDSMKELEDEAEVESASGMFA